MYSVLYHGKIRMALDQKPVQAPVGEAYRLQGQFDGVKKSCNEVYLVENIVAPVFQNPHCNRATQNVEYKDDAKHDVSCVHIHRF